MLAPPRKDYQCFHSGLNHLKPSELTDNFGRKTLSTPQNPNGSKRLLSVSQITSPMCNRLASNITDLIVDLSTKSSLLDF